MFVTNWISTTKIQKISEITNFFRHYFLSRTEVFHKGTAYLDGFVDGAEFVRTISRNDQCVRIIVLVGCSQRQHSQHHQE